MTVVKQLRYYARAMAPSGLGGPGEALASCRRVILTEAADEIARLRAALQWIADQVDNEDGDLDDIILCANKALAHEQRGTGQ